MSANITIREDGFAEAAYTVKPAWHKLGQVFDHAMSSAEALEGAGLDWEIGQRDLYYYEWKEEESVTTPLLNHKLNIRKDNGFTLGVVSDHYKLVQNTEAFEFMDALVSEGQMTYESAFSLSGGKQVILVAQMPGIFKVVEDDPLVNYIMLSMTHDGTQGIQFGPTSVRVVCSNTYQMAVDTRGSKIKKLSISHKGDIKEKLAKARILLTAAKEQLEMYNQFAVKLAGQKFAQSDWKKFLDIMCPELDPLDPDFTPRRARNLADTRDAITACYNGDLQQTAPHTAWAAFNAVTEHIDHLPRRGSGRRQAEARFNVTFYGVGRDMKQRAYELACIMSGIQAAV